MNRNVLKILNILIYIFSAIVFFFIGFYCIRVLNNTNSLVLSLIFVIVSALISFFLSTVFHEFGHLIAGFLSGYSFIMLRIQDFLWVKTNDGLKMKRQYIQGMVGQAMMAPPKDQTYPPFILYHSGGLLMNLVLMVISLVAGTIITNPFVSTFLIFFGGINFLFVILNGIPNGINDGTNLYRCLRSKKQQKQMKQLLIIYEKTILGEPLDKIAEEIYIDDDYPIYHSSNASMQSVYASSFFETFEFERAKEEIKVLWENFDQLFLSHKPDIAQNYLFTLLMTDPDHYLIHKIYNGKFFEPFMEEERADIRRIRSVYALCAEHDPIKAYAELTKGKEWINDEPSLMKINLETKLYDYIEDMIKNSGKNGAEEVKKMK